MSGERSEHVRGEAAIPKPAPEMRWIPFVLTAVAGLILVCVFSKEISNSDFWWHLKTGEYICRTHSLPDPDPFAYTTAGAGQAYDGEAAVRHFNLTHEWLAQVSIYLVYRAGGFGGVVLERATLLLLLCFLVGLIAYRRCEQFYRALAAALAAAATVVPFAVDRPYLVTFVFLAAALAILEWRQPRLLLLLPLVMLVWANCHGGFILGWVAMGAYSAEALYRRLRARPGAGDTRLFALCAASVLVSGINPNGFSVVAVLLHYRESFLQSTIFEWKPPALWPPSAFSVLLLAAVLVLLWKWRDVRMADWLLFLAFAAAGLTAGRNTFLVGILAPILLASYLPGKGIVSRYAPRILPAAALVSLAAGLVAVIAAGEGFQLRMADWAVPSGAADFLLANRITQPMLNTYEYGGYLIWKLWPRERVFIDGRALSESVFDDNQRILANAAGQPGKTPAQLLDKYGVEVVVMNPFEYTTGLMYMIAPVLDDPAGMDWKLVYAGADAMVFLRHPPQGMPVLAPSQILDAMESGCRMHIEHEPQFPDCADTLGQMFLTNGYRGHAVRWLRTYLAHEPGDSKVKQEYVQLLLETGGGGDVDGEPGAGASWAGKK